MARAGERCIPHLLSVHPANVQLEVAPAVRRDVIARWVRAVEAEEDHRLLHHLLRLKEDREARVLERDPVRRERPERRIAGRREDHRRLRLLRVRLRVRPCATDEKRAWAHLAESAVHLFVERAEAERADVACPVVTLGHGPILDLLGADPAHLVLAVLARRDGPVGDRRGRRGRDIVVHLAVGAIGLRSAGSAAAISASPAVVGASATISAARWLRLYGGSRHSGFDRGKGLIRIRRSLGC